MSATTDRVGALVTPVLQRLGLRLYDVDQPGPILRVLVDRDGGVDIDSLAEATREISRLFDEREPVAGSYTLEVSSPGLERPLRRPAHFEDAVGERVKVKLFPGSDGDRRFEGELVSASGECFTVEGPAGSRTFSLNEVAKATTVFEWSSAESASSAKTASTAETTAETTTESTTESKEDTR